jgi:type IV fimbrial biogenesis protein FimT
MKLHMPVQRAIRAGLLARRARGFTLIELMVTVTVIAILALIAAPSFNEAILSNKLAGFSNNFVASVQLARSEAIKRNTPVTLCRSADGQTCATTGTWQQGWIVMCKFKPAEPGICATDGTDNLVISVQQALPADYRLDYHSSTGPYIVTFQPVGGGATVAALMLCRATPSAGSQERIIGVSFSGRASVTTTRTGVCG